MKKFLCLVSSLAMCAMFAVSANAAEGITADEQKIIDNLKSGVVVEGTTVNVPDTYLNAVEKELAVMDVTAEEATAITAEIEAVKTLMKDNKITSIAEIKGDVASSIFAHAQKAAAVKGYTLKINTSGTVDVINAEGKTVFTADKGAIKDTGDDYTSMFAMTGAFALILAGAGVVASKKGYFAK